MAFVSTFRQNLTRTASSRSSYSRCLCRPSHHLHGHEQQTRSKGHKTLISTRPLQTSSRASFHSCVRSCINILDTADKSDQVKPAARPDRPSEPTPLSDEEYHEQSDRFFETLLAKLEQIQEDRGDWDVEYSVRSHATDNLSAERRLTCTPRLVF